MKHYTKHSIFLYILILILLNSCSFFGVSNQKDITACEEAYSTPEKEGDVYLIRNWRQLVAIGSLDRLSYPDPLPLNGQYKLSSDINFPDSSCPTILSQIEIIGSETRPFTGVFDGNGKTLSGLLIQKSSSDSIGLFSVLGDASNPAEVKNLTFNNLQITANSLVGAVAGSLVNGSVTAISIRGKSSIISVGEYAGAVTTISKGSYAGGLVGKSAKDTTISGSSNASVMATNLYVGGIVGYTQGTVYGFTTGSIGPINGSTSDTTNYVGGLVGQSDPGATIIGYSTGTITGNTTIGGLVGFMYAANTKSTVQGYVTGTITGGSTEVGGLVGVASTTEGATTTSTVTGYTRATKISGTSNVGGLIGIILYKIALTGYSRSPVHRTDGTNTNFGRIIGWKRSKNTAVPVIKAQYSEAESTIFDDKENKAFDAYDRNTAGITKLETDLIAELKTDLWQKKDTSKWPALVFSPELSGLDGSQTTADTQPIAE